MNWSTEDTILIVASIIIVFLITLVIYVGIFSGVIITEADMVARGFAEHSSTTGELMLGDFTR